MTRRSTIRSQLCRAWHRCISEDYSRQLINSERSLQASFWAALRDEVDPRTRRIFIEPSLSTAQLGSESDEPKHRLPDIVICNTRSVIAIVELKFTPWGHAKWQKDLEALRWMARNREHIAVRNRRYRGPEGQGAAYPISPSTVFVWAGVHATADMSLRDQVDDLLLKNFLELHAVASSSQSPEVWHAHT